MNTKKKMDSPCLSNEEAITGMSYPFFGAYGSELFYADLVNNNKHSSDEAVLQQPYRSHDYVSAQPIQSGFNQIINHPSISKNLISKNYSSSGSEAYLQTKPTGLQLAHSNTTLQDYSCPSWEQPSRSIHGEEVRCSGSWLDTTAVQCPSQSGAGKQRIRWTSELHQQFVEAVNSLGGPMNATPKSILRLMKSHGLTIFHIKSHLQKYRTTKRVSELLGGKGGRKINHDGMPISNFKGNGGFHLSETLHLQMDVQRTLHEHLEFQKKLQLRIEEHANYLQKIFDWQKRSCSFFENHNSNKATNPTIAECSSTGGFGDPGEISH